MGYEIYDRYFDKMIINISNILIEVIKRMCYKFSKNSK